MVGGVGGEAGEVRGHSNGTGAGADGLGTGCRVAVLGGGAPLELAAADRGAAGLTVPFNVAESATGRMRGWSRRTVGRVAWVEKVWSVP